MLYFICLTVGRLKGVCVHNYYNLNYKYFHDYTAVYVCVCA